MKSPRLCLVVVSAPVLMALLALAPAIYAVDQPAASSASESADGARVRIKSMAPASPAKLAAGEKFKVTIDYHNPEGRAVQIFARPFTKGVRTSGYRAHASDIYRDLHGTAEGWFEFEGASTVDEVRVEMVEVTAGGTRNVVASIALPIQAVWDRKVDSSPTAAAPAADGAPAPVSSPAPVPVALKIAEDVLRKEGVFGFPQAQATVFCDTKDLRFSVWSNGQYLYAQAILWKDDDAALGKTDDGRAAGDNSQLMLDVDADGKRTKDVDRSYLLDPWPQLTGLSYDIWLGEGSTTQILSDTHGRGAIRYVQFPDGRKVRVDSYVIPLAEIRRKTGDKIRLCYYGDSPKPALTVNSGGFDRGGRPYYSHHVPLAVYHEYVLAKGAELPLDSVPDGRKDAAPLAERQREPMPPVGAPAPEIAAKEWLHADGAPTLAALRGQVVLVEFWATWCGPCVASIPHLNALQKKFGSRPFKLLSFTQQDRGIIDAFLRRTPMEYVIGTESEATFERYGIIGIPAAFVVDKEGKISWEGHSGEPALEAAIEAALAHD